MKYKQIVFDIDGTLIDTENAILHSLQDTLKTLCNEEVPFEELTFALGITGEDALKKFHVEDIPSALDLWDKNMLKYDDTITVFSGIHELLERLSGLGYEMGIITSKTKKEYESSFISFGIHSYFRTVVCADDTTEHKPTPAPMLKYMELTGTDSGSILYVGDSEYDARCAGGAGVDFALAVWGSHRQSIPAEYYLREPSDMVAAIND